MEKKRSAVLRRTAFSLAVTLLFLFFLMWKLNFYLAANIKEGLYLFIAPVLIVGVLYFRGLRDGLESKLLAAFMAWLVLTRIVNGDRVLNREYLFLLDMALMLPMFALGLVLDAAGRKRVLTALSVVLSVYFFVLGCLCIYTFISHNDMMNPITGGHLTEVHYGDVIPRICALDTNCNVVAYWFMIPLLLAPYLFFSCRRKLWRVPIVLSALVDYIVIAYTYCRSVMLASSLCFGLLAVMLLRRRAPGMQRLLRALLSLLLFAAVTAGCFLCYGYTAAGRRVIKDALDKLAEPEELQTQLAPAVQSEPMELRAFVPFEMTVPAQVESTELAAINRAGESTLDELSSGRLHIYRAALEAVRRQPAILLRGCAADDVMKLTNAVLEEEGYSERVHMHNFVMQCLLLVGVPGLLLVLVVCARLVFAGLRLALSEKHSAPFAEQTLALPVLACLIFGQFESGFFNYTDERTLYFYLISGFLIGCYRRAFPPRTV